MLSRRLFEGPDIEKLLARIQADLGPAAQVVSAEKVRKGGVGGFFARETYQVVVEAPEQQPRQLLRSIKRRGSAVSPAADAAPDAVASPSTEGATFAELLRRLTKDTEEPGALRVLLDDPVAEQESDMPRIADMPRIDSLVDDDLTAMFSGLGSDAAVSGQNDIAHDVVEEAIPTEPTPLTEDDWQAAEAWLREAGAVEAAVEPALEEPEESPEYLPAPARALQPVPLPREHPVGHLSSLSPMDARPALRRMGLPTAYLPADDVSDLVQALYVALSRVPAAPAVRLEPGDVMVVVGDARRAFELAGRLSVSIGLDPASIVVASLDAHSGGEALALTSGEAAGAAAEQWSTLDRPTIVSISAAPGSGSEPWAKNLLAALQPAAIWGVVEATRKPEDVAAWSRAMGHVDALALEDLHCTTTPAAVLSTGIPVALIDGQLASAEAWTALLSARLRMAA